MSYVYFFLFFDLAAQSESAQTSGSADKKLRTNAGHGVREEPRTAPSKSES